MAADALTQPPSVDAVLSRLKHLLTRAREVKSVETIEPPLPVAEFVQEVRALGQDIFEDQPDPHRFAVVETAARKIFHQTVVR